jgi:rhamnosyltransferase
VAKREIKIQSARVCGVVVTYFPPEGLPSRLKKIAEYVDDLVIVDNSATTVVSALLVPTVAKIKARLISNPENRGIAAALNQGVDYAQANGATWVVFFDQDSEPNSEFRTELESVWSDYDERKPLGIIGCNHFLAGEVNSRYPTDSPDGKKYVQISSVITSGSAYAMTMLSALGPFKAEYFIDCVDTEYCWRARISGFNVCITTKPLITHTIGAPTSHRIFGRTLVTWNHSPFRRYFIGRNNMLLFREYFCRLPRDSFDLLAYVLKTAAKICLAEQEKRAKLSHLLLGIWHGILRRSDVKPRQVHR